MELKSLTPNPRNERLPKVTSKSPDLASRPKVFLKRLKSEHPDNIKLSWTNKMLNWKSILEDQKDYRKLITRIEIYNQKLAVGKRRKMRYS